MVDRPRPGDPAGEPSEAALRMIVDALTAPGTPEELSRESVYLEVFRALSAGATVQIAAARRRRRRRLAAFGGVAALAVTGTAAALTGSYPGAGPAPGTRSVPAPAPTASKGPGSSRTEAGVPTGPGTTTTTSGPASRSGPPGSPTSMPPAVVPSTPGASTPGPKTPSPRSPSPSATAKASPTPGSLPNLSVLRAYCKQYQRGKVAEGSNKWEVLVLAATAADLVDDYCTELLADED